MNPECGKLGPLGYKCEREAGHGGMCAGSMVVKSPADSGPSTDRVRKTAEALKYAMERGFEPALVVRLIGECVIAMSDYQIQLGKDWAEAAQEILTKLENLK